MSKKYYVVQSGSIFDVVIEVLPQHRVIEEFDNTDEAWDCCNEAFDSYSEHQEYLENCDVEEDRFAARQMERYEAYRKEY